MATALDANKKSSVHPEIVEITDALSFKVARLNAINDRAGSYHYKLNYGITLNQWRILGLVSAMAPVPSRKVRESLYMDKGQFSRVVNQLVDRGLVQAVPLPWNASALALDLTDAGRELHKNLIAFTAERNASTASTLSKAECKTLIRLLDKITEHAHDLIMERQNKS